MLGQLHDWFADNSSSDPPEPPLSGDSDAGAMGVHYHDNYFVLHASVRGTGCSAGEFDLFSEQSALDGYDVIEHYIVDNTQHDASKSSAPCRSSSLSIVSIVS